MYFLGKFKVLYEFYNGFCVQKTKIWQKFSFDYISLEFELFSKCQDFKLNDGYISDILQKIEGIHRKLNELLCFKNNLEAYFGNFANFTINYVMIMEIINPTQK